MSWVDELKKRVEDRLTICKDCPFFLKATRQCSKCGCFMPAKTWLANTSCPLKKWVKIEKQA